MSNNAQTEFNYIDLARRLIPGETDESLEYIVPATRRPRMMVDTK